MKTAGFILQAILIVFGGIIVIIGLLVFNRYHSVSNQITNSPSPRSSNPEQPKSSPNINNKKRASSILDQVTNCLDSHTQLSEQASIPEIKTINRNFKTEEDIGDAIKCLKMLGDEEYYAIVQFPGPITDESKAKLTSLGIRLYDYVPQFAFIAKFDNRITRNLNAENIDVLRWIGAIHPEDRTQKELLTGKTSSNWVIDNRGLITLNLRFYEDVDVEQVNKMMKEYGGTVYTPTKPLSHYYKVEIPLSQVKLLADENRIAYIEPYTPAHLLTK